MFALKAPLVEQIVAWKMGLYDFSLAKERHDLSPSEKKRISLDRHFQLRRELWTKPLTWLKAEIEKKNTDRFLLGVAAGVN